MDNIKEKIDEIVAKLSADENLKSNFMSNPVETIEKMTGIDIPDDIVDKVIEGVKAKISVDDIKDAASDALDKIKKMF